MTDNIWDKSLHLFFSLYWSSWQGLMVVSLLPHSFRLTCLVLGSLCLCGFFSYPLHRSVSFWEILPGYLCECLSWNKQALPPGKFLHVQYSQTPQLPLPWLKWSVQCLKMNDLLKWDKVLIYFHSHHLIIPPYWYELSDLATRWHCGYMVGNSWWNIGFCKWVPLICCSPHSAFIR